MIQKLTDLTSLHFYMVFITGLVVVGFLTLGTLLRKPKCALASSILTLMLLAGFVFAIYNRYKYAGKVELYLGLFLVISFLNNLITHIFVVLKQAKFNTLIKSASSVESVILAYLNDKGRVLHYTNDFLDLFHVSNIRGLQSVIHYIHRGEHQYSYKSFLDVLADEKEDDYDLTVDLSNSKELKLSLSKRKIIHSGNLLGYVLIQQKAKQVAVVETSSSTLLNSLNLVTEAIAVFESDSSKFAFNKRMQTLLGVEEVDNLDDYIHFDDRKQLEKRAKAEGEKSKIYYRLEALNNRFWVQESIIVQNSKLTKVIRETDFRNLIYNFRDYSRMVAELDQMLMTQNNFALVFINIDSLSQIKDKLGKDVSLVLATTFFGNLNNEIKDLKVFEIGYYKYAFFIKNDEVYNNILRDLNNNNSGLLKAKLSFNDMSFDIKSYLGIVERKVAGNVNTDVLINYAEEALKLASNKNYSKDYSIYFSKKKQIEADVQNIDLSDDFLDKILK
ncbi:MAG: hypothetical protein WC006_01830 [Bacilli bacterium]|nr:hypothetical protein [Bacilli bacterium]